jgi:hypothetical protein
VRDLWVKRKTIQLSLIIRLWLRLRIYSFLDWSGTEKSDLSRVFTSSHSCT